MQHDSPEVVEGSVVGRVGEQGGDSGCGPPGVHFHGEVPGRGGCFHASHTDTTTGLASGEKRWGGRGLDCGQVVVMWCIGGDNG